MYKRAREYLNGQIAATITTANFNSNAPIIGATQGEVTVADQLNAWNVLADQKVPLEDSAKLRLMVHNNVYRKMLGDSAWVQESLVSAAIAKEARQTADVGHAFNFQVTWDQQMPTASGTSFTVRSVTTASSTTVTGINTVFTQQLTAGTSYLTFGNDPTKTLFKVTAIASDTILTIGSYDEHRHRNHVSPLPDGHRPALSRSPPARPQSPVPAQFGYHDAPVSGWSSSRRDDTPPTRSPA